MVPYFGLGLHAAVITGLCRGAGRGGMQLQGLGVTTTGLARFGASLVSVDSMAWRYSVNSMRPRPRSSHGSSGYLGANLNQRLMLETTSCSGQMAGRRPACGDVNITRYGPRSRDKTNIFSVACDQRLPSPVRRTRQLS